MKLTVIFLCLSVANFIGNSGALDGILGGGAKAKKLGEVDVIAIVFNLFEVLKICNCLKTCDESEIPITKKDACKAIIEHLKFVANILTLTLVDVVATLDYTGSQMTAILSERADDILVEFDGNIDPLLAAAVNLTQSVCAVIGVVLKTALGILSGVLGSGELLSDYPGLVDTIEEILDGSSALRTAIGPVTLVPGATSILSGVTESVKRIISRILGDLGNLFGGKSC